MKLFGKLSAALLILQTILGANPVWAQRQMENLGRGVVAVHEPDGKVFVSWRLLGTDPAKIAFNLYRKTEPLPGRSFGSGRGFGRRGGNTNGPAPREPVKLNAQPLNGPTWFLDTSANLSGKTSYYVRPVLKGEEQAPSAPFVFPAGALPLPYLSIPLKAVENYNPGDASAADLDGDGEYEIILIQNGRGRDNGQAGITDPPVFQAYKLDGTLLWEIKLKNVRGGAHYTQFIVYDFDGDGRAELACKTGDGTLDGTGKVIGDPNANHVNPQGHVTKGPEFLTVFDGLTGAALATTHYVPGRHPTKEDPTADEMDEIWGDNHYNRSERYLAGVAYLDGQRPSLIMCRGYYTRTVLAAWDWRDGKLTQRWVFDSDASPENRKYRGQGDHALSVADVDGDGRDEIIYGACVIDDDGKGLYSTGWGHGDALHVSDLNPKNPGLEVFSIQERFADQGMNMRDAKTGKPIFLIPSVKADTQGGDTGEGPGRGVSFNIDPRYPGNECWAFGAGMTGMYSAAGKRISEVTPHSCNFAVYWDGDFLRELLDRNLVSKWDGKSKTETTLLIAQGQMSINGTKATPALSADLFGDWREEIIWRSNDGKELRIYTTTIPTKHRLFTLMHDPQYRCAIAWQNVAYNQPPHPSFYLDESAPLPPLPKIVIVPGNQK